METCKGWAKVGRLNAITWNPLECIIFNNSNNSFMARVCRIIRLWACMVEANSKLTKLMMWR